MRVIVEGPLRGDFEGWTGETLFEFDSGSIWRQAMYEYWYHYAYRPRARVFERDGVFWFEVDQTGKAVRVERVL